MVARYAGASLGLPAFHIVVTAGLIARHTVMVVLSRNIFAPFLFCLIGLLLGRITQVVLVEHEDKREMEIRKRYHGMQVLTAVDGLRQQVHRPSGRVDSFVGSAPTKPGVVRRAGIDRTSRGAKRRDA